jgi:hypothetical protein
MHKSVMINNVKKCLRCGIYHGMDKQYCPECGRYLYICGSVYQPKIQSKKENGLTGTANSM